MKIDYLRWEMVFEDGKWDGKMVRKDDHYLSHKSTISLTHLYHLSHLNLFLIFGSQILVIAREEFWSDDMVDCEMVDDDGWWISRNVVNKFLTLPCVRHLRQKMRWDEREKTERRRLMRQIIIINHLPSHISWSTINHLTISWSTIYHFSSHHLITCSPSSLKKSHLLSSPLW